MFFKIKILKYWLIILLSPKHKSRAALEAFQAKRMNSFARKTLIKSPFYQPYFTNKIINWNAVPFITKTEFMDSFNEINTTGVKLDEAMQVALKAEHSRDFTSKINEITVGLSTGTSGKRGLFLVSEDERAHWAALVMKRVIKPKLFKKQKVAFFLRANSNLYSSVASSLFEFKYFDIFNPINMLLDELNLFQPHVLAAQPSVLIDIAEAQLKQTIHIEPFKIISFAEVLHQNDKENIETIFRIKITEVYQCTEGFLGVSCAKGTMHLNEDFIHFDKDWVDENKFHPIVTDFSRHCQPVVKYKMNDLLQIKMSACECGSKHLAIEKIIGRDDDVLIINHIKVYPDLVTRKIAMHTDSFQKYTITQMSSNELQIEIDCPEKKWIDTKNIFESVLNNLFNELGIKEVEYQFYNKPIHSPGNKIRKIKRLNYENKHTCD